MAVVSMDSRTRSRDVIVVGAGVIGLATAFELQRRGLLVTVVDPEPGSGASRAAAGMIAPVSEVQYQQEALSPLMRDSAAEYPAFAGAVQQATGLSVGYRRTETMVCAADAADRQTLLDLQQYQQRHGMQVEQLSVRAARSLEPALSPRLAGAFHSIDDHQVDPRRLMSALLAALSDPEHGESAVLIREPVVCVLRRADGVVAGVRLADGQEVRAAETVLSPGIALAQLHDLPAAAALPVRPVHGDILRTRLPAGLPPLLERTIRGVVGGMSVYLVPRTDGEIVIGATTREDRLDGANAGGVLRLLRDAQTLVPGVADLELTEVMARARPGTPDDIPCLGRMREDDGRAVPGLVISTGYFRHGVLLAPLAARLTAQLVTGEAGQDPTADAEHLLTADPHRFAAAQAAPEGRTALYA